MASDKQVSTPPHGPQSMREAVHREIIGVLMVAVGIALVSSFVAADGESEMVGRRNELGVGIIVLSAAVIRFFCRRTAPTDVVMLVFGAWMVGAPAAMVQVSEGSRIFDRAVGSLLIVLALLSLLLDWMGRRTRPAGAVEARGADQRSSPPLTKH